MCACLATLVMSDSASQWTNGPPGSSVQGFSCQEWEWAAVLFSRILPIQGSNATSLMSPALEADSLTLVPPKKYVTSECEHFWLLQTQYNF